MKRILAYKAKVGILAGGTFGQGPNVGRNWSGLVRLEFSGRKMESRLKPGPSGRVSGPKTGPDHPGLSWDSIFRPENSKRTRPGQFRPTFGLWPKVPLGKKPTFAL